jgi:hypothetical protein
MTCAREGDISVIENENGLLVHLKPNVIERHHSMSRLFKDSRGYKDTCKIVNSVDGRTDGRETI